MKYAISSVIVAGCFAVVGCAGSTSDSSDSTEADIAAPSSAYTSLASGDCPALSAGEASCAGMPGWSLVVQDDDSRNNVQVKNGANVMDLDVWGRLPAFSHLGPKAEWRGPVTAPGVVNPYALIFRFFQQEADGTEKSFLVVSRITPAASCIVGTVDGGEANGNQKARDMADGAKAYVCPGSEAKPQNAASIFTDLDSCPTIKTFQDGADYKCTGTAGYSIEKEIGDDRDNIVVNTPHGKVDLKLWALGGGGFSSVGPTADWRVNGPNKAAHALIFRRKEQLNADPNNESNTLIVVKLAGDAACIYDVVDAKKHTDANVLAHVSADASFSKACPATAPAAH